MPKKFFELQRDSLSEALKIEEEARTHDRILAIDHFSNYLDGFCRKEFVTPKAMSIIAANLITDAILKTSVWKGFSREEQYDLLKQLSSRFHHCLN